MPERLRFHDYRHFTFYFYLKSVRGHMMPPSLHVCNGLARPANESTLRDTMTQCKHNSLRSAEPEEA